jgi:purine-binding chemotaxis protein CheW
MKKYSTFKVNGQLLGVEVQKVYAFAQDLPITRVPGANKFVKGLIHFRGHLISAIDLRKVFDLPEIDTEIKYYLILRSRNGLVSFIVDEFLELEEVNRNFIRIEIPRITAGIEKYFLSQAYTITDEDLLLIIDIEKIIEFKSDRVS